MRKLVLIAMMTAAVAALCACGEQHSKAFRTMQQDVTDLQTKIQETNDCDELQMLNFGVMGLRSDLDNLPQATDITEAELLELATLVDGVEASWRGKVAALDCNNFEAMEEDYDTSGEEDYPSVEEEHPSVDEEKSVK